jgi:2-aminoadipate transaminase
MLDAMDDELADIDGVSWIRARGGLYVWLKVGAVETSSQGPLFQRALDEGVLYVPGIHCYPQHGEPAHHDMIRLSFGVQTPERIREGIAALGRAIREIKEDHR